MTALVSVETALLAVMAVFVVGLLRSHAEILRRLGEGQADDIAPSQPQVPEGLAAPRDGTGMGIARDIAGQTLDGDAVKYAITAGGTNTLLAFLSSGCAICETFWAAMRSPGGYQLPPATRLIVVTKDTTRESPSRLEKLAPRGDPPVVMSTAAWEEYEVPTAPYFVYIDSAVRRVVGEGAAVDWKQVLSLLGDAIHDAQAGERRRRRGRRSYGNVIRVESNEERNRRADAALTRAGIFDGDPSLEGLDATAPTESEATNDTG